MKYLIVSIALCLSFSAQANEPAEKIGQMWYCTAGHGDCKNAQKRGNAVIGIVIEHTGCSSYESACASQHNKRYIVEIKEQGSGLPGGHYCYNYHYIYEIGATTIVDGFGNVGVQWVTNYNVAKHCSEPSGNPNTGDGNTYCGGAGNGIQ